MEEEIRRLILWPEKLTEIWYLAYCPLDIPLLQSCLMTHKHTLKALRISQICWGHWGLINACDFPNLELLLLSRRTMSERLKTPIADADLLLGPSLKTFLWDFGVCSGWPMECFPFEEREEAWLIGLASAAIARKTPLTTIAVMFAAQPYPLGSRPYATMLERINRVHDEVKQHGLAVMYEDPTVAREQWTSHFAGNEHDEAHLLWLYEHAYRD